KILVVEIERVEREGVRVFLDERLLLGRAHLLWLRAVLLRRGARGAVGLALGFGQLEDFLFENLIEELFAHRLRLAVEVADLLLDFVGLCALFGRIERMLPLRWRTPRRLPVERRLENGAQPVVIALRNRIVAVIMALRAADGEAEQRRRHNLQLLGDNLVAR